MKKFVNAFMFVGATAVFAGCPIYSDNGSSGGAGGGGGDCRSNGCTSGYTCTDQGYGPVCMPNQDAGGGPCNGTWCSASQTCELLNGVPQCVTLDAGAPKSDAGTDAGHPTGDGSVADGSAGGDGSSGGSQDGSVSSDGSSSADGGGGTSDGATADAGSGDASPPVCTIDGQQGGCVSGSICIHYQCYNPCSLDAGTTGNATCALVDQLNTCMSVATADAGSYSVCVGTPGNDCNPAVGFGSCASGGVCVNGYCK